MGLVEAWAAGGWGEEKYPRTGLEARDRAIEGYSGPRGGPPPLSKGMEGREGGGDGCLASIKMRTGVLEIRWGQGASGVMG